MAENHNGCDCRLCQRDRQYERLAKDIHGDEAKAFFADIFDALNAAEFDLAWTSLGNPHPKPTSIGEGPRP